MVGESRSGESFLKGSSGITRFISHPYRYAVWNSLDEFRTLATDTSVDQGGDRWRRYRARGDLSIDTAEAVGVPPLSGVQSGGPGRHCGRCVRGRSHQDQYVAQPRHVRSLVLGYHPEPSAWLAPVQAARCTSTDCRRHRPSHPGRGTRIERGPLRHSVGTCRTIRRRSTSPMAARDRRSAIQGDQFHHRRHHGGCESPLSPRTPASGSRL